MANVFFGYGGSLRGLAGRRLKMRLCSKLCKEIFDICLPVKLSGSLEALSTLLFATVVHVIVRTTAIFRVTSPIDIY